MKMSSKIIAALCVAGASSTAMAALTQCPAVGASPSCAVLITINPDQSLSFTFDSSVQTYDGSDDTLVGVLNNSGQTVTSFVLTSSATDIFGFDGDGISTYGAPTNSIDLTGYGGPMTYFSFINPSATSGTVNFVGGLAAGGTTYFGLEENISQAAGGGGLGGGGIVAGVPEPSTYAFMIAGLAGLGAVARSRKKNQA